MSRIAYTNKLAHNRYKYRGHFNTYYQKQLTLAETVYPPLPPDDSWNKITSTEPTPPTKPVTRTDTGHAAQPPDRLMEQIELVQPALGQLSMYQVAGSDGIQARRQDRDEGSS